MSADYSKFAVRFRMMMAAHGETCQSLAKKLDVSHASISKWMTGVTMPNSARLMLMCSIFGCSLDWLFGAVPFDPMANLTKEREPYYNDDDLSPDGVIRT